MKISGVWSPSGDVFIPEEELKRAAKTLIGRPVRVNFQGTPVGVVTNAEYVPGGIRYTIDVQELKAGFIMKHLENNEGHGITFTELSFTRPRTSNQTTRNENE